MTQKICDCVLSQNGLGMADRECNCPALTIPPTGDVGELIAIIGKHLKGRDVGCTSDELHCRAADALTAAEARIAELERERDEARQYGLEIRLREKTTEDARVSAAARAERLEAALRGMENAFVLLSKAMQTSEIGIPLDVGLATVEARDAARAILFKHKG